MAVISFLNEIQIDIQIEAVEWENISLTVIMYICNFVIAFKNNVQ